MYPKVTIAIQVSLWYSTHSTPNPLGVLPDPAVTRTVRGDKFAPGGVHIVQAKGVQREEGVVPPVHRKFMKSIKKLFQ